MSSVALHGLIQTATLSKKKKREVKQQGLVHLPALACVDGGVVKPSIKIGVEDRAHTHLDLPLQSIPKEWRSAITVTDPDNRLIYADWRACHLQLIAYCSGDTAMTQFFEGSPDFYTALPVPKPPMPADPRLLSLVWTPCSRRHGRRQETGAISCATTCTTAPGTSPTARRTTRPGPSARLWGSD